MPETTNGLPYPTGLMPPDVPLWLQQLAQALDPYVADLGRLKTQAEILTLTSVASWTRGSVRATGNWCSGVVELAYTGPTVPADSIGNLSDTKIGVLVPALRPAVFYDCLITRTGYTNWIGRVDEGGNIYVTSGNTALTNGTDLRIQLNHWIS